MRHTQAGRREFLIGLGGLALGGCGAQAQSDPRPRPAPTLARKSPSPPLQVAVIGAGLSGLAAAWRLAKLEVPVSLFEARIEPGGRIRTLRGFAAGFHVEAGATHVVADPDLMALLREFAVAEQRPARPDARLTAVQWADNKRWLLDATHPGPPGLALSPQEQRLDPMQRARHYFGPLEELDRHALLFRGRFAEMDRVSVESWLRSRGASEGYVQGIRAMFPLGDGPDSVSALAVARELAHIQAEIRGLGATSLGRIAGGTDRLPQAIAKRLGDRVHYRHRLVALRQRDGHCDLEFQTDTGRKRLRVSHVILTLPFSVLRNVTCSPEWSRAKREAINALDSTPVTRLWLETRGRPWEARGERGSVDTDLDIGKLRHETLGQAGTGSVLGVYLSGSDARTWSARQPDAQRSELTRVAERLHPGVTRDAIGFRSLCWHDEPFARGAYAFFRPGQLTRHAGAAGAPEGRVFFAGDGVSSRPGFMHGAVASAKRAVHELTRALGQG